MTPLQCHAPLQYICTYLQVMNSIYIFIYFFTWSLLLFIFIYLSVYLLFWCLAKSKWSFFSPRLRCGSFCILFFFVFRILTLSGESQILPAYDYIFCFVASCQPTLWFIDSQVEVIFAKPNEYPVHVISMWTWVSRGTLSHLGCAKFFLEPSLSC